MSCCGKKRKEWMNELKSSADAGSSTINTTTVVNDRPNRVFEYTGEYSLMIKGAVTGKNYFFKHPGHLLEVDSMDSPALMAERNLRVVK